MKTLTQLALMLIVASAIIASYALGVVDGERTKICPEPEVVEVVRFVTEETICPDCKNDCDNLYLGVNEHYLFVYNLAGEPVAFWERCWSDTTLKD